MLLPISWFNIPYNLEIISNWIIIVFFSYATSDGASRSEQGGILNPGTKEEALDVKGAVRWYDDKGKLYEMTYKAGKRGYRTIIRRVYS